MKGSTHCFDNDICDEYVTEIFQNLYNVRAYYQKINLILLTFLNRILRRFVNIIGDELWPFIYFTSD